MRTWIPVAVSALALVAPLQAQDAAADQLEQTVLALEDEYDEAYADWREGLMAWSSAMREARAKDEPLEMERPAPVEPRFWPRFDRAAKAGSMRAQMWCVQHYTPGPDMPKEAHAADFTRRVLQLFTDPTVDHSLLPRTIMGKSRGPLDKDSAGALLVILEKVAGDAEVASQAAYYQVSMDEVRGGTDEQKKATLAGYKRVAAVYPATKWGGRAGGKVFKEERLQIGMVAPEIVGKDVDGNDMKLTDFRGKVTVIDFWGFW
jgi:hypothetical protein